MIDAVIAFFVVRALVKGAFNDMARAHPATDPLPDAVSKRFQSFQIGIVNLGLCVHVAVDDECLHLTPIKLFRCIGALPSSVPWSAVEPVGKPGKRRAKVKIGMTQLRGPAWALSLATPPPTEETP
ncbi:MAG: hypothetical protein AAGG07_07940 [Planctomycetota bacterium]